jgi:hypothetical protein
MPIRINLLAEAQAAEERRRRDPVKRAVVIAVCLIAMVLVWISSLQLKIMADNSKLGNLEHQLNGRTNEYNHVLNSQKQLADVNDKLKALNRLASERFLHAPLLNALMRATVDGIQITRFSTEQVFDITPEVKPVLDHGRTIPGKPAVAVERIKLLLNARDTSPNPGSEEIGKFKSALVHTEYFQAQQISTNNVLLKNLQPAQTDDKTGKTYVAFSLECNYADKVR